jgi:hypothetical protein
MELKRLIKKTAIRLLIFLGIGILIILSVFTTPVRYDGPYKGKVVDAETGEPIEGVVVLGVWYSTMPTPAGEVSKYYDAEETVTDKNGEFEIPGKGLMFFTRVEPISVIIFKAGYSHYSLTWRELEREMKKERGKLIIPLKKLSLRERLNRFGSYYVNLPNEKQKLLLQELEKEKKEIGK